MLEIHQFPCLSDNYGVLIREPSSGMVAAIDAPSALSVTTALRTKGWRLTHILNTHHHGDHTDGNLQLKAETNATIVGPRGEASKIPGIDIAVGEPESFPFGAVTIMVLDTPGHTLGHISYWLPDEDIAFVGDTVFALGCGRVSEGTMEMMWNSVAKIAALPRETMLYCGHEYTLSNAKFALTIEPDNEALAARLKEVTALRSAGKPTVPSSLRDELATNPFLRVDQAGIRARLGLDGAADWQVFAEIRERKNRA